MILNNDTFYPLQHKCCHLLMDYRLIVALLLTASCFVIPVAHSQMWDFPHIETQGIAELSVPADMAIVQFQTTNEAKTSIEAKQLSDNAVKNFLKQLATHGIKDSEITTANLTLRPQYHYNSKDRERVLTGYQALRRVTVTIMDLAKLNPILDSALKQKIDSVNQIQLKSSQEKQYLAKVRDAAIKDAKQKADALAKGFDTKVKRIWKIGYTEQRPVRPLLYSAARAESQEDDSAGYRQEQLIIRDKVEVVFQLSR